ncbi:MAG: NAD(P)/FAD-dependent oxidoreductase [Hahellaceae bacterium]|nr:NAD(P)/FAD-dependent oxidoreductase [Hahellaceae bacterium]
MCALTAAQRGRQVLVLEKANRPGKKILMSGGGRCNFTNRQVEADNFISANPHFVKAALKRYTPWDFIAWVESRGIPYEERKHQQLFCQDSARDILDMLLDACEASGVEIRTACETQSLEKMADTGGFRIAGLQGDKAYRIEAASLVIATGALSIPTLGGSGYGYEVARQFGLDVTPLQAGLVPFMFTDALKPLCESLAGVSLEVEVECRGRRFREALLFTHRGMSGPAILQISNYWQPGDTVTLNLLPDLDAIQYVLQARQAQGKSLLRTVLQSVLPKGLVLALQSRSWQEKAESPLGAFNEKELRAIGHLLNAWVVKPSGTEGYRTAEVTRGGVDTTAISSKTMEARQVPGLYFIGEVLDVTGHLGGFNFQWAWSSGYSAGLVA